MITTVSIVIHPPYYKYPTQEKKMFMMRTFRIYTLYNFQIFLTAMLIIVIILYITHYTLQP